jgi:type IV secretion system protein VirD4
MQLPPEDEIILVSGAPPIRAQKVRYFRDVQLKARIQTPPNIEGSMPSGHSNTDDWSALPPIAPPEKSAKGKCAEDNDGGIRREPEIPEHEDVSPELPLASEEFAALDDEPDDEAQRAKAMQTRFRTVARQAALDPDDGIEL